MLNPRSSIPLNPTYTYTAIPIDQIDLVGFRRVSINQPSMLNPRSSIPLNPTYTATQAGNIR